MEHYRGGLAQLASWMAQLEALRAELQPGSPPGLLATAHGGWALSADGVRWGRSAVWSRAFTVHRMRVAPQAQQADSAAAAAKAAVDERVVALVPLVDMCDHVPEARVAWHMGRDGGEDFQFMTQLPVAQVCRGGRGGCRAGLGGVPGEGSGCGGDACMHACCTATDC